MTALALFQEFDRLRTVLQKTVEQLRDLYTLRTENLEASLLYLKLRLVEIVSELEDALD